MGQKIAPLLARAQHVLEVLLQRKGNRNSKASCKRTRRCLQHTLHRAKNVGYMCKYSIHRFIIIIDNSSRVLPTLQVALSIRGSTVISARYSHTLSITYRFLSIEY